MAHCGRKAAGLLRLYKAAAARWPLPPKPATVWRRRAAWAADDRPSNLVWQEPEAAHLSHRDHAFLRLLGVVYLIAFVSLWRQIDGLIGDHGMPAGQRLSRRGVSLPNSPHRAHRSRAIWNLPTLAWINPHDGFFHVLCGAGTLLSILLILGVLPLPAARLFCFGCLTYRYFTQVRFS